MPVITEGEKTYWMPDNIPQPTEDYQSAQSEKTYLTHEGKERRHPGWTYSDTNAFVDDEYLFRNEGWKVIVDDGGLEVTDNDLKHKIRNTSDKWEKVNEISLKVTYILTDFTKEETDKYTEQKWEKLRGIRDVLLSQTDWIITRATEESLTVSSEVTSYRQELRNFPTTVTNILEFNLRDETLLPKKPKVYFKV